MMLINEKMNVSASLEDPYTFIIKPKDDKEVLYITSIRLDAISHLTPDEHNFCGLDILPNGVEIVLNINNESRTLTKWRTHNDIKLDMYLDFGFLKNGSHRTRGLIDFSSSCLSIKLDGATDDSLEIRVQDDLSGLESFKIGVVLHSENIK